jgi:rubrerythrin
MTMSNDNFSTDEVRRQLRVVDRANDAVMPRWREALERIMGGDEKLSTDEKAAILGVPSPSRRNFFRLGGVTILGAAVLAACGSDDDDTAGTTPGTNAPGTNAPIDTTAPTAPATTPGTDPMTTEAGDVDMDLTLAKTAASLEKLAIDVYGQAGALLTTPAVIAAATMFAGHHQLHLEALNGVITGAGEPEITQMNQAVFDALVAPALADAASEADAVNLALALEEAAAQTYAFAAGALSTPALRSTIMTIGGIETRHAAVLRMAALAQPPTDVFPEARAFFPGDNPLAGIDGALIS